MHYEFPLFGSLLVCIVTVVMSVVTIRKDELPKYLRWAHSAKVWKSYDYVWYGSGLIALAAFWMAQVERAYHSELDELTVEMELDTAVIEGIVRATVAYCDTIAVSSDFEDEEFRICFWVRGTLGSLQAQGTNRLFPTVPINQTVHSLDSLSSIDSGTFRVAGLQSVKIDWGPLNLGLYEAISDLHEANEDIDSRLLLPAPQNIPNGLAMDGRLARISQLRNDLIPNTSPVRLQGTWWLFLFAFLIGLKVSKTYAELKLR